MIPRHIIISLFEHHPGKELLAKISGSMFADRSPVVLDVNENINDLSESFILSNSSLFSLGFIISRSGSYEGVGSGYDLLMLITRLQIDVARRANPLTMLPGNWAINEYIDKLLFHQASFVVCYIDLDNFKPYNDIYGYHRGDDVIQLTARILSDVVDFDVDFIGHIGGDDFIILFQSDDWLSRCQRILSGFSAEISKYYDEADCLRGGLYSSDRRGNPIFYSMLSISIGVICVSAGSFKSHHEVSASAAIAKKIAKEQGGGRIFVEQRRAGGN